MSDKVTNPATQHTGPASAVQLPPEQGSGSELYMLVLKDVMERAEFGAKKYGHPLRTSAGVDFTTNAYQETLDLLIYLRADIELRARIFDLLEEAWGVIANAGWNAITGDVDEPHAPKSPGWNEAALRWRDKYFALIAAAQVRLDTESPVG